QQARWLDDEEKRTLAAALAAEHKQGATVSAHTSSEKSIVSELLSPAVVKFAIAYFCLVNTLAMVAVWTPLIVKSFSADASNRTIGLLA
ncbi:4-hydroxyphenylacetate permease, partial [Paraburkholderia sp. SIMBA_050]